MDMRDAEGGTGLESTSEQRDIIRMCIYIRVEKVA